MHQYHFGYLLIALAVVFMGLGYWRAHQLGAGWRGWVAWGFAAVLGGLAAYPFSIPTTPQNNIRVDLGLIIYFLLPFLSLLALVGLMKAIVDTKALGTTSGKGDNAGATAWRDFGLRLIAGGKGLKRPLWVGLVFAPLAGGVVFFVLVSLVLGARPPGNELSTLVGVLALDLFWTAPVNYLGTLLFGPLLVIGLRKAGALSFRALALGALPLGGIAFLGWRVWYWGRLEEVTKAEGVKIVKGWAYL